MGIMDMFQDVGKSFLSSITPTKKPGEFCPTACNINDIRCEACLAEQDKIRAAIDELQNLEIAFENAKNNPQATEANRVTKCSVCGAPIEKGEQSCPYCGEPYPAGAVTADIPASEMERDNMLLQKASEIYDMYAALKKRVNEYKSNDMKDKLPDFLDGAAGALFSTANKFVDMTPQEIRQLSRQNGVGYRDYVVGVIQGMYKSAGDVRFQQINEMIAKQQQINASYRAENNRIEMERQAKLRQINQESYNRQMAFLASKPAPQYSGGPGPSSTGSCCGNCRFYMVHDNKCAYSEFRHPTGANDYCNNHRST